MSLGDHPEDDKSKELNQTDQELFQMLIGTARWIISLGWIDILFAVLALDRFNASPRDGHLVATSFMQGGRYGEEVTHSSFVVL